MLTSNQIETIFREDGYKAFMTELPQQADELESQGFFDLFEPDERIKGYSYFETHTFGSYQSDAARNPGEPMQLGTMGQGYNYHTALRSEFNESRSMLDEYLQSVLKFTDYAATQGKIMAENYMQSYAQYWSSLFALGGIVPATLTLQPVGAPGNRSRLRMFAHYLKGQAGAVIAEIPKTDAADPDGKAWFAFKGNEHVRSNGDTSASFDGKTEGYYNAGGKGGGNLFLTEKNLTGVLLHMENDLPYGPDRKFYAAPRADTLVVSGNLRSLAAEIIDLNLYQMNTPNNNKSTMQRTSGVFSLTNLIVDRFLPDNCWYVGKKGKGIHRVMKDGRPMSEGMDGPMDSSIVQIYYDTAVKSWVRDLLCFWSHRFDSNMDICWYAGSTPTVITNGRPVAPAVADLQNFEP